MAKILVVEDEDSYREPLTYQLNREGFEVVEAATGPEALARFAENTFDMVLLDLMLPGISGTEVCHEIRTTSDVPIIMLTAKDSEIDKVVGLEIGADDYLTKPYSFRELLARIRAVLRRQASASATISASVTPASDNEVVEVLEVGPVRLDYEAHLVTVRGEPVALPLKEFDLLDLLMRNKGRVLSRRQLINEVWGSEYVGDTKTLDVHVKRLRAKIEPNPRRPRYLQTVRGLGYKITD